MKLKKCKFYAETNDYLVHYILSGQPVLGERTRDAAVELKQSTTQTKHRLFSVFSNVFGQIVPNFALLGTPLSKTWARPNLNDSSALVKIDSAAVVLLKASLTRPTVLALAISENYYTIGPDAYNTHIWSVLPQRQDNGNNLPVSCCFLIVNEKAQELVTMHRKCLSAIWVVTLFRLCLQGTHSTIRPDHEAMWWTLTMAEATVELER